jgi:hypothetical protein
MAKNVKVPAVHGLAGEPMVGTSRPLALALGLHEAMFLQRVYFWIMFNEQRGQNQHEDRSWMYNTYEQWHADFPFWSNATIRRIVDNLRSSGVLITKKLSGDNRDHTLWYTIDFEVLEKLMEGVETIPQYPEASHTTQSHSVKLTTSSAQTEQSSEALKLSKSCSTVVTAVETFRTSSADADKIMGELDNFLKGVREKQGVEKKPRDSTKISKLKILWKALISERNKVFAFELPAKEVGFIRALVKQSGGQAAGLMSFAVANWAEFTLEASMDAGEKSRPAEPSLGYLVTHWKSAAKLMAEKTKPVKKAAPVSTPKPASKAKAP